ncbi:hypothetical protein [Actinorugispora endophytica]|uniref:Uncharacterized protein n=1 Tax=Actinorugispora endophytica TaxID=1605990 RepID=A0A4R6UQ53_9ACTN|nr:hypothetical protein [Actinorugispora endophytica]TDQ45384.1 hypothetical protein EV190_1326 [Actinorugispora endophytica]
MTDVHALPTPIVPQGWGGVDTSIDTEVPELLSEDQFDRYTETVAALLDAAGLTVRVPDENTPGSLRITNQKTGFTVELDMRDDRGADWTLEASDEIPEGTTALRLAIRIAEILGTATPDEG